MGGKTRTAMPSIADGRGQPSRSVRGRLGCGEAKTVAASKAAVVIEDATVDEFAQSGTGQATGRAADHGAEERTEDTAEEHAWRTGDEADGHANFDTRQATGSATDTAANRANQAGSLTGAIAGGDTCRVTVWALIVHCLTPVDGKDERNQRIPFLALADLNVMRS